MNHFTTSASVACSHVYGSYVVTVKAGCTTSGSRYRVCKLCRYKSTETIYPTGHSVKSTVVAPTCTKQGYTYIECTVTGCDYGFKNQIIDPLGHNIKSTSVVSPTCTQPGQIKNYCTRCSYIRYSVIAPHGHVYNTVNTNVCCICGYKKSGWSYMFKSPEMATHICETFPKYKDGTEHHGIDIINKGGVIEGYKIYASCSGEVVDSHFDNRFGRGQFVEVLQDNGYTVRYLHMIENSAKVVTGQKISAGTLLGQVGSTGRSTGPHLHYDVKNSSGNYIQPVQFFPQINFTYS